MDTESGKEENIRQEIAKIEITLFSDQSISVHGSIGEKVLAYGMLECAKEAIFARHLENQNKKNGSTSHGIINFARRFK